MAGAPARCCPFYTHWAHTFAIAESIITKGTVAGFVVIISIICPVIRPEICCQVEVAEPAVALQAQAVIVEIYRIVVVCINVQGEGGNSSIEPADSGIVVESNSGICDQVVAGYVVYQVVAAGVNSSR